MSDDGERVLPWLIGPIRRIQRWQYGHTSHWGSRHVTLGRLPDGRWMVEHSDVKIGARAYHDEQRARHAAGRLTARDGWREVPAAFDGSGQPTEPGWYRSGGTWLRRSEDAADDR